MIYLQNMKFERLIFWPGGAYTDAMNLLIHESWLHRLIGKYPKWAKNIHISDPEDKYGIYLQALAFFSGSIYLNVQGLLQEVKRIRLKHGWTYFACHISYYVK